MSHPPLPRDTRGATFSILYSTQAPGHWVYTQYRINRGGPHPEAKGRVVPGRSWEPGNGEGGCEHTSDHGARPGFP